MKKITGPSQVLLPLLKLNNPQNSHSISSVEKNANNAFKMVFKKSNYIIAKVKGPKAKRNSANINHCSPPL